MANKMLIDATHPEETQVVVLRGNRVEEFDFESANRKQLRGNIYLAKVTRVEPSLQAAFVDYGGNRHGFLAFSEIHPDYYQIPVADRQALIAAQERAHRDEEDEHERRRGRGRHRGRGAQRRDATLRSEPQSDGTSAQDDASPRDESGHENAENPTSDNATGYAAPEQSERDASAAPGADFTSAERSAEDEHEAADTHAGENTPGDAQAGDPAADHSGHHAEDEHAGHDHPDEAPASEAAPAAESEAGGNGDAGGDEPTEEEHVESVGGADALEEAQERAPRVRTRQYKIQEVIKRRQVMLVQVVKEERGTKGAALTTYLSLAGRYCVLMPNTARGGGISRKITSSEDRNRLKEIAQDLEVPEGMGVILRTAGASRTKSEVKRDFEYLLRLWEQVRDLTLKSTAPKLVYEEGSLTRRSIRDLYNKDIDEIIVSGEDGYKDAKEFMRMLMPSHAKNVKLYRDTQPLFTRFGIESQLDAMFSPTVQLRSGGYIVINQAEALVAIDVNSGRATREHHIEDTALKTNCEAAEEVARQLRLRDLAGLIVIDFIDMDEGRNNRSVERRLKEALKHDRARIQVGRISHFGLMEMSRQRIRTSVLESSTEKCPVCGGSGHVRSVSSVTLALLRSIEETLIKGATHNLIVRTRPEVALYILNQKRGHLRSLEERFRITITVNADSTVVGPLSFVIDRGEQVHTAEAARSIAAAQSEQLPPIVEEEEEIYVEDEEVEAEAASENEIDSERPDSEDLDDEERGAEAPQSQSEDRDFPGAKGEGENGHRRRRRRGGRGRGRARTGEPREYREPGNFPTESVAEPAFSQGDQDAGDESHGESPAPAQGAFSGGEAGENGDNIRRRRRRGRRGGRRNRHRNGDQNGHNEQDRPQEGANFETRPVSSGNRETQDAPVYSAVSEPRPAAPASAPAPSAELAPHESAPRRSTVREAAPVGQSWATTSAPSSAPRPTSAPVVSGTAAEETATPKRGWWGKRLLGGKD